MAVSAFPVACADDDAPAGLTDDEFVASCLGIGDEEFDPPSVLCIGSLDGDVRELDQALTPGIQPALSPGRDLIAVVADGQIVVLTHEGEQRWVATAPPDTAALAFEPGGETLLVHQRSEGDGASRIVRLAIGSDPDDTGEVVLFEDNFVGEVARGFALSPNGGEIAYVTKLTSGSALRVVSLVDLSQRTLATSEEGVGLALPEWSPSGTYVAVVTGQAIERIDVATGARTIVASTGTPLTTPTWSPDGSELLVVDARGAVLAAGVDSPGLRTVIDHTDGSDGQRFPALPVWT